MTIAALLAAVPTAHPRLHLDAAGLAGLRERAATSHRRYADLLFAWVERNAGWQPPVERDDRELDEVAFEECAAFVTNAALAAVVGGREEHRELARRWALAMCRMPKCGLPCMPNRVHQRCPASCDRGSRPGYFVWSQPASR